MTKQTSVEIQDLNYNIIIQLNENTVKRVILGLCHQARIYVYGICL